MYRKRLSPSHVLGHALMIAAAWGLFALAWWWVVTTPAASVGLNTLMGVTVLTAASTMLITQGWIRFNTRTQEKRRAIRFGTGKPLLRQRDWNGHLMIMSQAEVRYCPWLCIRITGPLKTIMGREPMASDLPGDAA
jgi:hypothetical protein